MRKRALILSAGIVVVRRVEGQWRYLILRAYAHWDFPKGEVEEGESPLATAQREVVEETGIRNLHFRWGMIFRETEPYRNGSKRARYYLAETREAAVTFSVNPAIGGPEHHEYRWADLAELNKLAGRRLQPIIDWARAAVES